VRSIPLNSWDATSRTPAAVAASVIIHADKARRLLEKGFAVGLHRADGGKDV
jgi:hypothetical protein